MSVGYFIYLIMCFVWGMVSYEIADGKWWGMLLALAPPVLFYMFMGWI